MIYISFWFMLMMLIYWEEAYVLRGVYRVLMGKPEGKRTSGRLRRRWGDKMKMDLQGVSCGVMDLIDLAKDRDSWRALENAVMNLRVSYNAGTFLTS
jgi:hypothetical protein